MWEQCAESILDSVTMSDLCGRLGLEVNRAGFVHCPFHGEKTASLKIYPGRRGWYCFGCGTGGSVITFYQKYANVRYRDAVRALNEMFCLGFRLDEPLSEEAKKRVRFASDLRRFKREQKERELKRLNDMYDAAWDAYRAVEKVLDSMNERDPDEQVNTKYAELYFEAGAKWDALKEIEYQIDDMQKGRR